MGKWSVGQRRSYINIFWKLSLNRVCSSSILVCHDFVLMNTGTAGQNVPYTYISVGIENKLLRNGWGKLEQVTSFTDTASGAPHIETDTVMTANYNNKNNCSAMKTILERLLENESSS